MDRPILTANEYRILTERGLRIGALALELARGPQFGKRLSAEDFARRLAESVDDAYDPASFEVLMSEALLTVQVDCGMSEASEILLKAAELIEPEGAWTRDEYWRAPEGEYSDFHFKADWYGDDTVDPKPWGNTATCFCLLGAIGHVMQIDPDDVEGVPEIIGPLLAVTGDRIASWNDAKERTQAEVIAALRKAADLAKGTA